MRHISDFPARLLRRLAQNRNRSPCRMRQSCQSPQQGRLPRPVIAQNYVKFLRAELRVHSPQRGETSELLDQIPDSNDGQALRDGVSHRHGSVVGQKVTEGTLANLCIFAKICKALQSGAGGLRKKIVATASAQTTGKRIETHLSQLSTPSRRSHCLCRRDRDHERSALAYAQTSREIRCTEFPDAR